MTARSGFFAPLLSAFMLATAACGSAPPGESTGSTANAIDTSTIVSRAMEWVDAGLHYCQSSQGNVDGDSSCWAWEGAGHVCHRQSNAEWNAYRSDCSGFVTWSWGLPPVGDGGYITSEFAPYDNSFSHTIDGAQLQPGDALNKTPDEHIVLFKQWVVQGQTAIFMEEPGCSVSTPYAHEFTSNVSISGPEVYIDYEGATFYAIRYDGVGGGGGTASNACSFGDGYCTATMQCDAGQWVPRQTDSDACTSGPGVSGAGGGGASSNACSYGNGYCTNTMQCDNGQWVTRQDDASACTSGPGATSGSGNSCSYGDGYCTATEQCDSGHWVRRRERRLLGRAGLLHRDAPVRQQPLDRSLRRHPRLHDCRQRERALLRRGRLLHRHAPVPERPLGPEVERRFGLHLRAGGVSGGARSSPESDTSGTTGPRSLTSVTRR